MADLHAAQTVQNGAGQEDRWLTIQQAAGIAQVSPDTVRRACQAGRLRAVKVNGARVYRLRLSWLTTWLEASPLPTHTF